MCKKIERENLNKHLTNNVVLRIDYVPIPDEKVDQINNKFAKKFLADEQLFSDVKQTYIRNIDIQMNDPSIQDFNEFINVKEKSRVKSYEYYKLNDSSMLEMKLTFNRQFCAIDVNQNIKYCNYEIYRDIFLKILNVLKEYEIIINRFGLRKFNDFFVKKDADINEYVKEKFFNLDCKDLLDSSESLISEKRYNFVDDVYHANLITHTSIGKLDDDIVKRIAFDIDMYITEIKNLTLLFEDGNEEYINNVNDILFEIYINLLNDKLKNILDKESDIDDENLVLGVDYNEIA